MKKIIIIVSICLTVATKGNAQTKIGYASIEDILIKMPEKIKGDSLLTVFQNELATDFASNQKALDDIYAKFVKDSIRMNTTDKNIRKNLINKKIADLNQLSEKYKQLVQIESDKLLQPATDKLLNTIKSYAKDNAYTVILHANTGVIINPENDITQKLKTKLGLK